MPTLQGRRSSSPEGAGLGAQVRPIQALGDKRLCVTGTRTRTPLGALSLVDGLSMQNRSGPKGGLDHTKVGGLLSLWVRVCAVARSEDTRYCVHSIRRHGRAEGPGGVALPKDSYTLDRLGRGEPVLQMALAETSWLQLTIMIHASEFALSRPARW